MNENTELLTSPPISIIIPFYNSAAFIEDAIKSVEQQTCDYEAVFVDDGSIDDGYKIVERYVTVNPRLKLVRQTNQGANRARANGVKAALGEWVTFLDADDVLLPSFSKVVAKARDFEGDIVYSTPININKSYRPDCSIMDVDKYRKKIILGEISTGPWAKFFRRKLFTDFVFDFPKRIISAEDYLMNIRLSFNTHKDVMIASEGYYLVRVDANPQSAMKTFKGTWDYGQEYDRHLNNSFPGDERTRYLPAITKWRLKIWHYSFRKVWKLPKAAYDCEYFRLLQEDIKRCDYKPTCFEAWNMRLRNPLLRAIADMSMRSHGIVKRIKDNLVRTEA